MFLGYLQNVSIYVKKVLSRLLINYQNPYVEYKSNKIFVILYDIHNY
jgi:hypothetical protein